MKEVLLLKCGEIVLKGLNRKTFEDRLLKNLSRRMKHVADCEISMRQSVVYGHAVEALEDDVTAVWAVSYTHPRAPQKASNLVCRLLLAEQNDAHNRKAVGSLAVRTVIQSAGQVFVHRGLRGLGVEDLEDDQ